MKIQCNVCEAAEAEVLCCADEAVLCRQCDEKVHAANKLATKHQRVRLSASSSHMPTCDICQETVGYFFCLEDRALFCRKCDVAIHTANSFVSTHQRFLLTGVRVGLEATEPVATQSSVKSHSRGKISDKISSSVSKKGSLLPQSSEYNELLPIQVGGAGEFQPTEVSYGGGSTGNMSNWPLDEIFGLNEFSQNYNFTDNGPSKNDGCPISRGYGVMEKESSTASMNLLKGNLPGGGANGSLMRRVLEEVSQAEEECVADSGKLGDSDSSVLRSSEEEMDNDDHLGWVPDSSWTVPQIPSPPTASGLYWPKDPRYSSTDTMFVPDICSSHIQQPRHVQKNSALSKRQRRL